MMATRRPVFLAAVRMRVTTSACWSKLPCEKLSRAIFMPARIRLSNISGEFDAGPMVATILVLLLGNVIVAATIGLIYLALYLTHSSEPEKKKGASDYSQGWRRAPTVRQA
jgi:hypothetical protein